LNYDMHRLFYGCQKASKGCKTIFLSHGIVFFGNSFFFEGTKSFSQWSNQRPCEGVSVWMCHGQFVSG